MPCWCIVSARRRGDSLVARRAIMDGFPFSDDDLIDDKGGEADAELPVIPLRDTVLFPHMVTPFLVGRDRSARAVEEAVAGDRSVVLVSQRHPEVDDVGPDDLYGIGTEATINRVIKMPDGTSSILVQGKRRLQILDYVEDGPFLTAKVASIGPPDEKTESSEAMMRVVLTLFEKCIKLNQSLPEDAYVAALNVTRPGWLADLIASTIQLDLAKRQDILETLDPSDRLQRLSVLLAKELDVLDLENHIQSQIQQEVDKNQREYYLREQLKAIQRELGEDDPATREISQLRQKIEDAEMPEEVARKATEELERLAAMPPMTPEVVVIRTYLDWLVSLPWVKETEDQLEIGHAAAILKGNHYGLPKVKERILEYLAVRKMAGEKMRSPILCFIGPPGVGKTSLGRSIAQAMGRKFVRVSLGGIRDEAEIRGHRRTYVGALPGRIVQTMRRAGTVNPVFMMDEIDKLGMDFRGDPSAALLEVLDPEQNGGFSDHYLDVPYDLSRVFFITTANILDPVPPALRDRMEVIELPGYIEEEKREIARLFLVPKQITEHGLDAQGLTFSHAALRQITREYTHEAGVRSLEREIGAICRKLARQLSEGKKVSQAIGIQSIRKYLGPPRFSYGIAEEKDQIGVATGVSWTPNGGDIMSVEVTLMEGKGQLLLTGQLGEVMRESAQAALSYVRARAKILGLDHQLFERRDIHIHVPAGAIPKDGPSAGITIATALVSALTGKAVRREVAMTGEITLRGRVLPVGGIKEKVLAAHRGGIETFLIPQKNQNDLVDVPRNVLRQLDFVRVATMEEVLPVALSPEVLSRKKSKGKPRITPSTN